MIRVRIIYWIFFLGLPLHAAALEAVVDHAWFYHPNGTPYTELYWHFNPQSLHYRKDSLGRLVARIQTQVRITCDTGICYYDTYSINTKPFNPDREGPESVLDMAVSDVPAGLIKVELRLTIEGISGTEFYFKDTMRIAPLTTTAYSSLQLLDTVYQLNTTSRFVKHGFQQVPRPLNFYDEGQNLMHVYLELNRPPVENKSAYPLFQWIWISRRPGEHDIPALQLRDTIQSPQTILPFRHDFSLVSLESGNYYLNVHLYGTAGVPLADANSFFQVINAHPVLPITQKKDTTTNNGIVKENVLDLSKTFLSKFEMPQLRAILKMMLPTVEAGDVATIKGFLDKPDELYMRYYIYNHFAAENKADPAKAWKLFSDKVREANKYYSSGSTMGYETDRGKIYLAFGEPAEVVSVPNEAGAQPYEIWRYNIGGKITGNGLFLFYSPPYAISDYKLLHSTVLGQRYNPNWRSDLYVNGQSSGNANARAEQYFGK